LVVLHFISLDVYSILVLLPFVVRIVYSFCFFLWFSLFPIVSMWTMPIYTMAYTLDGDDDEAGDR
jgi:hypothetical protein